MAVQGRLMISAADYALIRNAFMNTSMVSVPVKPSLMTQSLIEVVANGSRICP